MINIKTRFAEQYSEFAITIVNNMNTTIIVYKDYGRIYLAGVGTRVSSMIFP